MCPHPFKLTGLRGTPRHTGQLQMLSDIWHVPGKQVSNPRVSTSNEETFSGRRLSYFFTISGTVNRVVGDDIDIVVMWIVNVKSEKKRY